MIARTIGSSLGHSSSSVAREVSGLKKKLMANGLGQVGDLSDLSRSSKCFGSIMIKSYLFDCRSSSGNNYKSASINYLDNRSSIAEVFLLLVNSLLFINSSLLINELIAVTEHQPLTTMTSCERRTPGATLLGVAGSSRFQRVPGDDFFRALFGFRRNWKCTFCMVGFLGFEETGNASFACCFFGF